MGADYFIPYLSGGTLLIVLILLAVQSILFFLLPFFVLRIRKETISSNKTLPSILRILREIRDLQSKEDFNIEELQDEI